MDQGFLSDDPDFGRDVPSCERGERLAFRLLANPTKRDGDPREKSARAKVVGILDPEVQVAWLTRKLDGAAQIQNVYLRQGLPIKAKKRGAATHSCHLPVLFEGDLVVADAGKLRELVAAGMPDDGCLFLGVDEKAKAAAAPAAPAPAQA